jgi:hypothetical protein
LTEPIELPPEHEPLPPTEVEIALLPEPETRAAEDLDADQPTEHVTPVPLTRRGVAPAWHTALLVAGIVGFSAFGAIGQGRFSGRLPLMAHYGLSAVLELAIAAWVIWGLHLRRKPIRAIFGWVPMTPRAVVRELGAAAVFWVMAMAVLGSIGITWNQVEDRIYQAEVKRDQQREQQQAQGKVPNGPGAPEAVEPKRLSPQEKQLANARNLFRLAPTNLAEGVAWGLLCVQVGFSEELVFRGYLMAQGISLARSIPIGVVFSALIFGAAHGYQGLRGMVLIGVFGALFSILALSRRTLVPGMIAHAWHDFATGLLLAFLRSSHLLDHLPKHN